MKQCDLCNQQVDELQELKKEYQLYEIKELCKSCMKKVESFSSRVHAILLRITHQEKMEWYKGFIRRFKK